MLLCLDLATKYKCKKCGEALDTFAPFITGMGCPKCRNREYETIRDRDIE